MDAKDNGTSNPFTDTLCSLEWIASAMNAARRYKEQAGDTETSADASPFHVVGSAPAADRK